MAIPLRSIAAGEPGRNSPQGVIASMPWLPMYLTKADLNHLFAWLNDESDIAFIISAGPMRWRAVNAMDEAREGRSCLWHRQSGPLPLLREGVADSFVVDPWTGWTEETTGANPTQPYFGPGHPGIYWLDAQTSSRWDSEAIGLSAFEWIGNHYKPTGREAPPVTKQWWERLRRWVKKQAVRIPRVGQWNGPDAEIWAFPGALEEIRSGKRRDENP